MMKKLLSLTMALLLTVSLFGCSTQNESSSTISSSSAGSELSSAASSAPESSAVSSEPSSQPAADAVDTRVAALKGPTAMGMVKLMDDSEAEADSPYDFNIYAAVDEITPQLVQGNLDLAAVPANLASVLYNQTEGKVKTLAIHTLGVLYIVENGDTVQSLADLKGKTIYASGKGATPEYALTYLLKQSGIDPETDVTIEWKSEHTECLTALTTSENGIAMLPQPFVTTATMKNENIRVALDLNKEWEALGDGSALITGVLVGRSEFIDEHPDAVAEFLSKYEESISYVNGNVTEAAQLIEKYDIVPAAVAEKALPECNITFIAGDEMKTKLSGYLQTLFDQNPKAVGGAMPGDDFYYTK